MSFGTNSAMSVDWDTLTMSISISSYWFIHCVHAMGVSLLLPFPQLSEYDSVSRLDEWLTKHFLVVKKKINALDVEIN